MAPKRKAVASNGRSAKRIASGVSTPKSMSDDQEYSMGSESDPEDHDAPSKYDSQ
jgi:DNA excision repair protein ERCC-3